MAEFSLADYQWLASDEVAPLLRDLQQRLGHGGQVDVRLAASLRKSHSASHVHLLLEQVELRSRARAKFSRPEEMFFTRKGLEQATDEVLAAYKATHYVNVSTGSRPLVDICCGIGGDLLGLASLGPTIGYDQDPVTAHFAALNLRRASREQARVLAEWASADGVQEAAAWHIDPDRRPTGERTIQLDDYQPEPAVLRDMLARNPSAAIKVAPAAEVDCDEWPAMEREWLGSRGECRQQVLWFGELSRAVGQHSATVVDAAGVATSLAGDPREPLVPAAHVGAYVLEPDATILAAHLAGTLAQQQRLLSITPGGGYLTGDEPFLSPLVATFQVRDVLPFDHKKLKAYCREHGLGQLEIKKRGVEIEPFKLRREILAKGDNSAVILLTQFAGGVKAIVAERITA